ncbi:hypothetical protein EYC80_009273 [Monilinia laxa]|uniref:DASH complex subunit DAD1 n=1 Tax=Monilinia laxa TaxID=61186 RepID=A0A5N6JXC4_MONLA|nr:hypothetical protein EYC80_009273 [Monilinia laxa]
MSAELSAWLGDGRAQYMYTEKIAISFEHVLSSINKLNRSLEGVIAVGNEFSSVEALWSQFENVMAKEGTGEEGGDTMAQERDGEGEGEGGGEGEEEETDDGDDDNGDVGGVSDWRRKRTKTSIV